MKKQSVRSCLIGSLIVSLSLAVGCSSMKSKPSVKEEARAQWDAARAGVLVKLAEDQYANNELDKSQSTLVQAVSMTPENPRIHTLMARIAIEQGRLESAIASLELAKKFAP